MKTLTGLKQKRGSVLRIPTLAQRRSVKAVRARREARRVRRQQRASRAANR